MLPEPVLVRGVTLVLASASFVMVLRDFVMAVFRIPALGLPPKLLPVRDFFSIDMENSLPIRVTRNHAILIAARVPEPRRHYYVSARASIATLGYPLT
jgi:hypothetical protein